MLLQDKVCLISGVSSERGIGYATAELFARHGAKLAIADIQLDSEKGRALSDKIARALRQDVSIVGYKLDLADHDNCVEVVNAAYERFGRLDASVNCAAVVKAQSTMDITTKDFSLVMNVNLQGTFNLCQAVLAKMLPQKFGSIINVASVAAQRGGGLVGGSHYAASKGGVISFTKSIAREFGEFGIRANTVAPALTETGVLDDKISQEQIDSIVAGIPLRRAGRPNDIAGACLFLASDLSSYVTGATIDVNGGSHIH
jgi:NAD(P)-dependent dehydrogenase (short-subunit alcohol dehydrogenase family)